MNRIKVYLTGPFRIEDCDGQNLTPIGAKECAMIALLLRSRSGEYSRGWIQAKLWSDRGKDQAAASLRQAVSKIRKSLKDHSDILHSDRRVVSIDLDRVEISDDPQYEFLEGLDVRDEEFEAWLTTERSASEDKLQHDDLAPPSFVGEVLTLGGDLLPPSCIQIQVVDDNGPGGWRLERVLAEMATHTLSETFSLPIIERPIEQVGHNPWRLEIAAFDSSPGKKGVRVALFAGRQQRKLWSSFRMVDSGHEDYTKHPELLIAVQELAGTISEKLSNDINEARVYRDPNALSSIAVGKLFRMQAAEVAEADRLFERAFELHPRGLYLAWRAKVRQVQFIERLRSNLEAVQEECEYYVRRAMDLEPRNSTVLSILATARLYFDADVEGAAEFAQRGVQANPSNPMAWWAFGAVQVDAGNVIAAYECARAAADLAEGTPLEFWTKSQLSGAAITVQNLGQAKSLFKTVNFSRPSFRPPLRYLVALHATHEEWELAMDASEKLRKLEPDFSIDRLLNDSKYPAALLRGTHGLDRDRVRSLL